MTKRNDFSENVIYDDLYRNMKRKRLIEEAANFHRPDLESSIFYQDFKRCGAFLLKTKKQKTNLEFINVSGRKSNFVFK